MRGSKRRAAELEAALAEARKTEAGVRAGAQAAALEADQALRVVSVRGGGAVVVLDVAFKIIQAFLSEMCPVGSFKVSLPDPTDTGALRGQVSSHVNHPTRGAHEMEEKKNAEIGRQGIQTFAGGLSWVGAKFIPLRATYETYPSHSTREAKQGYYPCARLAKP